MMVREVVLEVVKDKVTEEGMEMCRIVTRDFQMQMAKE